MKDEDEEKIDAILRREYDLGFLLDYLDDRKNNPKKQGGHEKPYWLPIADILRFIPEFNREVEGIRLKYQIKPEQMKRDLMKAIGKNACNRYFTVSLDLSIKLWDKSQYICYWQPI